MVVGMVNLVIVAKAIESRPLFVCECFLCVLRHTHTISVGCIGVSFRIPYFDLFYIDSCSSEVIVVSARCELV
jgi:hypothetical protein